MTTSEDAAVWRLSWRHGRLAVHGMGAMMAPIEFVLPDGRKVSPMLLPDWVHQPAGGDLEALPAAVRSMRGEWPCVPFGVNTKMPDLGPAWRYDRNYVPNSWLHGYASNHLWSCIEQSDDRLVLAIEYPKDEPIARLERTIVPDPESAAVDLELAIYPRRDCRLPVGLHPTIRITEQLGRTCVRPGRFAFGRTYPIRFPGLVQDSPQTAPDYEFETLAAVPSVSGGSLDFTRIPFDRRYDDLVVLCGIDGTFEVLNEVEDYVLRVVWDAEQLPSCLVGTFNRGRLAPPFNGRLLGMEIEPVCSAFGLGTAISTSPNPISDHGIKTAVTFTAKELWRTRYRLSLYAEKRAMST